MSEEQEKVQRPKATLIKNKKVVPKEAPVEAPTDRKKVVVVKRRPRVVATKPLSKEPPSSSNEKPPSPPSEADVVAPLPISQTPPPSPGQVATGEQKPLAKSATTPREVGEKETPGSQSVDNTQEGFRRPASSAGVGRLSPPNANRPARSMSGEGDRRPGAGRLQRMKASPAYKQGYKNPNPPPPRPATPYGGDRFRSDGSSGRFGASSPRPPAGGRPAGRGASGGGFNRGGASRPAGGGSSPGASGALGKGPGRKFYKNNKKGGYQAKKGTSLRQERDFQLKKKTSAVTNPVPKEIDIVDVVTVSELARKMNLKASELIGKLMTMGMMVTINQQLEAETAEILAAEFGCKVNVVSLYDETLIESDLEGEEGLLPRPPIVTVMGHVDHGKTKLLDAIRITNVVDQEFGGITQHIGAYKVSLPKGEVVFIDTPGHEAFTLMRARGAQITDIAVIVVAANDGVMPQTIEAIDHAKDAGVLIIVAINKCDLPEANVDRVKQQISEHGLLPEDWGGDITCVEISALKGEGIDELLEVLILQSDVLELKANYTCRAEGRVIETRVDPGRGVVGSIIIQRGTLKVGDPFVAGTHPGKVRALFDDRGNKIESAPPATPIEVLGLTGVPESGAPFQVTVNEKFARQIGGKRQELEKHGETKKLKKVNLDNLYDSIQAGSVQELKIIIKGDVLGSVEALRTALEKLSTDEIHLVVIRASAGAIIENDVNLASASNAIIVGFHVRPTAKAQSLADIEKVDIRKYGVIYDCIEDIRASMEGLLAPEIKEEVVATVEVREVFKVPKIGLIAGCYVTSGVVTRNANVHVYRDGVLHHTGKISSLKRFKEDVRQVEKEYECGIGIENYLDVIEGDLLEVFEEREHAKKLGTKSK